MQIRMPIGTPVKWLGMTAVRSLFQRNRPGDWLQMERWPF